MLKRSQVVQISGLAVAMRGTPILKSTPFVPVPFPGTSGFDVRSVETGDRHLEDSEPVPDFHSAHPSRTRSERMGTALPRPFRSQGRLSHAGMPSSVAVLMIAENVGPCNLVGLPSTLGPM